MMSLFIGHAGSVLRCLQERYWVEHIYGPNTSSACFITLRMLAHAFSCKLTSADISKATCLCCLWGRSGYWCDREQRKRGLYCLVWTVGPNVYSFSQNGLLAVTLLSFLCSARLPCLCFCFPFACWLSQKQTSGFARSLAGSYLHFSMPPPQQQSLPLCLSVLPLL